MKFSPTLVSSPLCFISRLCSAKRKQNSVRDLTTATIQTTLQRSLADTHSSSKVVRNSVVVGGIRLRNSSSSLRAVVEGMAASNSNTGATAVPGGGINHLPSFRVDLCNKIYGSTKDGDGVGVLSVRSRIYLFIVYIQSRFEKPSYTLQCYQEIILLAF